MHRATLSGPRHARKRHRTVRSLREDALPILVERARQDTASLEVATALTAFASAEAATALARFVETKAAHGLLAAYYAKHPAWAKQALAPIASAKGITKSVRDAAAKLLSTLG